MGLPDQARVAGRRLPSPNARGGTAAPAAHGVSIRVSISPRTTIMTLTLFSLGTGICGTGG